MLGSYEKMYLRAIYSFMFVLLHKSQLVTAKCLRNWLWHIEAGHFSELYAVSCCLRWEMQNLANIIVSEFISPLLCQLRRLSYLTLEFPSWHHAFVFNSSLNYCHSILIWYLRQSPLYHTTWSHHNLFFVSSACPHNSFVDILPTSFSLTSKWNNPHGISINLCLLHRRHTNGVIIQARI